MSPRLSPSHRTSPSHSNPSPPAKFQRSQIQGTGPSSAAPLRVPPLTHTLQYARVPSPVPSTPSSSFSSIKPRKGRLFSPLAPLSIPSSSSLSHLAIVIPHRSSPSSSLLLAPSPSPLLHSFPSLPTPSTSSALPSYSTPFPDVSDFWNGKLKEKSRDCASWRRKAIGKVSKKPALPEVTAELASTKRALAQAQKKLRASNLRTAQLGDKFPMKDEHGHFEMSVKYASLKLSALGVPDGKQGEAMGIVATMLGTELSAVPGESTVRSWSPALSALTRMHTASVLSVSSEGLTLMRDETTKKSEKIQQHAVALPDGSIHHVGMSEVWDKSAQLSFDTLKLKVDSLSRYASSSTSSSPLFAQFAIKVRNLMSDRAATETLFNKIFQRFRDSLLEVREGWAELSDKEREEATTLCEHFCQLHAVANCFSVVATELAAHESDVTGRDVDVNTAGFALLLKEVGRYLSERSSGGHPEHRRWKEYAAECGIGEATIPSLQGHRFNVQFLIAARVYRLREHLSTFIERYAPSMSKVREMLEDELIMSHVHILGMLDQMVTGPLWRLIESDLSVLDSSQFVKEILEHLALCSASPALIFSGECPAHVQQPPIELYHSSGTLFTALVTHSPNQYEIACVQRVLCCTIKYLRGMFSQFLPGGEYHNVDGTVRRWARSAPSSNRKVESAFAFLDHLYLRAPHMRFFRREGRTCFTLNHTQKWLDSLDASKLNAVLQRAFQDCSELEKEEKAYHRRVCGQILCRMEESRVEAERKAVKVDAKNRRLADQVGTTGLIETERDLQASLSGLSQTQALNLVKDQLRYRRSILKQTEPFPGAYRFSLAGIPHSLEKLCESLKALINASSAAPFIEGTKEAAEFAPLVGTWMRMERYEDDVGNTYDGNLYLYRFFEDVDMVLAEFVGAEEETVYIPATKVAELYDTGTLVALEQ